MTQQNNYALELGVGIGPVTLGSNHEKILSVLGKPDNSKNGTQYYTYHYYANLLILEFSNETNLCVSVSAYFPAKVIFQERNLIGLNWVNALHWMQSLDPDVELEEGLGIEPTYSYTSYLARIAMCSKLQDNYCFRDGIEVTDNDCIVESVFIFSPEYYWSTPEEQEANFQERLKNLPSEEDVKDSLEALMNENFNAAVE
jgi:hypothetical protein